MKRCADIALNVLLVLAAVALPVLVVMLAIQGDWAPAANSLRSRPSPGGRAAITVT